MLEKELKSAFEEGERVESEEIKEEMTSGDAAWTLIWLTAEVRFVALVGGGKDRLRACFSLKLGCAPLLEGCSSMAMRTIIMW